MIPILAVTLMLSVFCDIVWGKIFNWITLPALVMILGIRFFEGSVMDLGFSLVAIILVFLFLLVPFTGNMIGGGDVKLLLIIAAAFDYPEVVSVFLSIFLCGGGIAFFVLVLKKYGLIQRSTFPYGVAIALGVVIDFL